MGPTVQIVQKEVPNISTQIVEKVVEVPHVLTEEIPVEVPQVQYTDVVRQDAVAQTREVIKQIPRVSMEYRERVVELQERIQQEIIPQPIVTTAAPIVTTTLPTYGAPVIGGYPGVPLSTGVIGAPSTVVGGF